MSVRKYLVAGLLALAGVVGATDRASAQVSFGPGGVSIGTGSGNGVVVPYNLNNGVTVTNPNGAYNPRTGNVYSPAYASPNGTTTYYSPSSGTYYNPTIGTTAAPVYSYPSPYSYSPYQSGYTYPNSGVYTQPQYNYRPGGYYTTAPVVRSYRVR